MAAWMVGCECPSRPADSSPTKSTYLGGGVGWVGMWKWGTGFVKEFRKRVGRAYLWLSTSQT